MYELQQMGTLSDIYLWRYVVSKLKSISACSTLKNIGKYHLNKVCTFSSPETVGTLASCYCDLASPSIKGQKL